MRLHKRFHRICATGALGICLFTGILLSGKAVRAADWHQATDGSWYYLNDDGSAAPGWLNSNGKWYYIGEDGKMAVGWLTVGNSLYYLGSDGVMQTGWQLIDGKWYYFGSGGAWISNNEDEAGTIKGIDVSVYQGTIDWQAVKQTGISFALIRAGHGNHNKDTFFERNITGAAAAGIHTGVYYYSTAKNAAQAILDAQFVIDSLRGYKVDYPVAIDLEDSSQAALGKGTITGIARAFCDEIRRAGYRPMVYCNENWARNHIDLDAVGDVDLWVARYNGTKNDDIDREIWQAGSTTHLAGITANVVDVDFCYRDLTQPARTAADPSYVKTTEGWASDSTGNYYYSISSGAPRFVTSAWKQINGSWYYFNAAGYMQTGWAYINGLWYYLDLATGKMLTGWNVINGKWYYMNGSGEMQQSCWIGGYWFGQDGAWTYAPTGSWQYGAGGWWFGDSSGWYAAGEWEKINGKWYYFDAAGYMLHDTVINGYTLGADGAWE